MVDADPFPFIADVRMQDAMLYSSKIEPIAWPEDILLDSIKSFDLSLDGFEVTIKAKTRPKLELSMNSHEVVANDILQWLALHLVEARLEEFLL